jgi:tRNA(His) 5'-end guanylyltransferase
MADDLGDRIKQLYESPESEHRFLPLLPVIARVDGRSFSNFTKGMARPYDERMALAMIQTAKYLVAETHALIAYTGSDEISLVWYNPDIKSGMLFDRRVQKLVSVLASMATVAFGEAVREHFVDYSKYMIKMPHFDARVFFVPSLDEAANVFLWRAIDHTKNSVSMAAHSIFSHKSLQGVGSAAMQERMFQEAGINFNDYPAFFKRGTFVRKVTRERTLTETEMSHIPEAKRPAPGATFLRSTVEEIDVPPFGKVINRVGFIFNGEEPIVQTTELG